MRIFGLARRPLGLLFDLDSTLYTNPAYAAHQEEVLVDRLARELGEEREKTRELILEKRRARKAAGEGGTSLGNLFAELGFDIPTSVRWREECIDPGEWLAPDERLGRALERLASGYALALVTNNPRSVGEKSLAALGVARWFRHVVGLDDTSISKPAAEPFLEAAARAGLAAEDCASIGDRFDVDLAPALAIGMSAILVDGVEDVYRLPDELEARFPAKAPR